MDCPGCGFDNSEGMKFCVKCATPLTMRYPAPSLQPLARSAQVPLTYPPPHLAARMEQMAMPGSILVTPEVLRLAEGYVEVAPLGPVPIKGLQAPVGEPGVGKSRLVYECIHSHRIHDWLILESRSVSYGKATAYLPVIDLLKDYCKVEDRDHTRTSRAKVTGQILTLDEALQETIPAVLSLLEALPENSPFRALEPPQRRQRTLQAAEFLYETHFFPELESTFKHALTHEVAYGSLLQEQRRALHARIVEALEALVGDRVAEQVERLAHHALRGEVWDKAVAYCRQAGEKALARSAHRKAVGSFEQALSALPHLPEQRNTREQARVELSTALALYRAMEMSLWVPQAEAAFAQTGASG